MKFRFTLPLLAVGAMHCLHAGEPVITTSGKDAKAVAPSAPKEESIYDKIWSMAVLYKNKDNPYIQELNLVGREHIDWFYFDADQGQDDDWVIRRTRIGLKALMFENIAVHVETDLNLQNPDPLYTKLTDAYIQWAPSKAFKLAVGKQSVKFTLEGWTSSNQLLTIDRSVIGTNIWFPEEYIPGVSISGEVGRWLYTVGYYTSGEASPEFGDFNAGSFGLVSIGYNFAEALGADKAILRADYVYQDPNEGNTFTRPNEQVGSVNFVYEKGRYGLSGDVSAAQGYLGQKDLFALQILPSVFLNSSKTLQGVFRYTFMTSDGDNGIRLARYENRIVAGRGDEYHEFYAGVNWYLYGHKLKLQTGVQYASMDDAANDGGEYDGWGITTGLRISW